MSGRKFLLSVDGSDSAASAVFLLARLACPVDTIIVFSCFTGKVGKEVNVPEAQRVALRLVEFTKDTLIQHSALPASQIITHTENNSKVREAILLFAQANHVSMIVTGSRGLGTFKRLVLGSVSTYLVHHSGNIPVLVVHANADKAPENLKCLHLADGSSHAANAAANLGSLLRSGDQVDILTAQKPPQPFTVVCSGVGGASVIDNPSYEAEDSVFEQKCQKVLQDAKSALLSGRRSSGGITGADVNGILSRTVDHVDACLHHIRGEHYAIIAVGSRGLSDVSRAILGSLSSSVLHEAKGSAVLVAH